MVERLNRARMPDGGLSRSRPNDETVCCLNSYFAMVSTTAGWQHTVLLPEFPYTVMVKLEWTPSYFTIYVLSINPSSLYCLY